MRKRVFGFDLIRAGGILTVLVAHSFMLLPGIPSGLHGTLSIPGILAAELFFALSGFLIGRLLIEHLQKENKWEELRLFWRRRWMRTLPLYFFFLGVACFTRSLAGHAVSWSLVAKYLVAAQGLFGPVGEFYGQSWTLGVEEWFYLLVPLFLGILATRTQSLRSAFLVTLVVFFVGPLFLRLIAYAFWPALSWRHVFRKLVFFRLDAAIGGLALAWAYEGWRESITKHRNKALAAGVVLLAFCAYAIGELPLCNGWFGKTILFSLTSLGCAATLPWFEQLPTPTAFLAGLVRRVALLSYALYLANNEVAGILRLPSVLLAVRGTESFSIPLAVFWIATFGVAIAANWAVERPFLARRAVWAPGTEIETEGSHGAAAGAL